MSQLSIYSVQLMYWALLVPLVLLVSLALFISIRDLLQELVIERVMAEAKPIWQSYKDLIKKWFPGKPKKVIERWDFIMVFEQRYREQMESYFQKSMQAVAKGTQYRIIPHEKQEEILVLLKISDDVVPEQAQELQILKRKTKKSFGFDLKTINKEIYLAEERKDVHLCDYLKWIRARLKPVNKKIYMQEQYSVFNKNKMQQYLPNQETYDPKDKSLFTPDEQLRTKYNYLLTYFVEEKDTPQQSNKIYPFSDIMRHAGFKELVPVHKDSKYGSVIVGNMKEYLGANSQTYFAFVAFLQTWLIFPTVIGLVTFLYNVLFEFTAEDSPADFLYAFFIMLWSIIFYTKWEHKQKWTAVCESTGYNEEWSQYQDLVDRQGSRVRESRLSGQREHYIPFMQKLWRYFASYFVCIAIFLATLYFMVLSLNARGFVDQNHRFLHFQWVAAWAEPGGIFDANTGWAQIPNLVHVLVTNIFDEQIFRPMAKKFTKYEQHFSNKSYENNIIIKYFVYEYIITFADLFYIAFVRMDIIGLREQLLSLFFIDIVRRLVAELLIPKLVSMKRSHSARPQAQSEEHQLASQAILEVNKDEYEPFDDYLQIVTNFGYLVMLSACFPLAPLLIMIAHSIESVQDKYKIVHIFKRKLPTKYVGMGYWNQITLFLCYTAILTNIMLFAFSSHQFASFFPKLYESGKDILFGEAEISDLVTEAASKITQSFAQSVSNATSLLMGDIASQMDFNAMAQNIDYSHSPFEPDCPPEPTVPLLTQFKPPAQEKEVEFVTILLVIQHVFLILFMCLRSIVAKQTTDADVLVERRQIKRTIKKHFKKNNILGEAITGSALSRIVEMNKQAEESRFQKVELPGLFTQLFDSTLKRSSSVDSTVSDKSD